MTDQEELLQIGSKIKTLRERSGITQAQLADLAQIKIEEVRRIEDGNGDYHLLTLVKYLIVLKTSLEDFFNS